MSYVSIGNIFHDTNFNLQENRKRREGKSNVYRNKQFQHINNKAIKFMENDEPVTSVDTKKKELIGNFRNSGKEWKPKGEYDGVNVYVLQKNTYYLFHCIQLVLHFFTFSNLNSAGPFQFYSNHFTLSFHDS